MFSVKFYDFKQKLNSQRQHIHANCPELTSFPEERRHLLQITSMFSFLYINKQSSGQVCSACYSSFLASVVVTVYQWHWQLEAPLPKVSWGEMLTGYKVKKRWRLRKTWLRKGLEYLTVIAKFTALDFPFLLLHRMFCAATVELKLLFCTEANTWSSLLRWKDNGEKQ